MMSEFKGAKDSTGGGDSSDKEVPKTTMDSGNTDKTLNIKCSYCFRIYRTVDELMRHLLAHQTKQVQWITPSLVLVTEAKEKKLPTCKIVISRCDNLMSPGQRFGTIRIGGSNVKRGDAAAWRKLTRDDDRDESGVANGTTEKIRTRKLSLKQMLDSGSSTKVIVKPHKCQFCPKSFRQLSHLKIHIRTHTGERPHLCQFCPKSFGQLDNLKRHILTHTGERPHKCHLCSKSFVQQTSLNNHIRNHTGERPHKCQFCSKLFGVKSSFKRHMLTHSDAERPHKCQVCSKSFWELGQLKRHLRTYAGKPLHGHQ